MEGNPRVPEKLPRPLSGDGLEESHCCTCLLGSFVFSNPCNDGDGREASPEHENDAAFGHVKQQHTPWRRPSQGFIHVLYLIVLVRERLT